MFSLLPKPTLKRQVYWDEYMCSRILPQKHTTLLSPIAKASINLNSQGILLVLSKVLLKWRDIYGWHFVTINQGVLINKVGRLFSCNLGGYEHCQTDHFIHYFWLMHWDTLNPREEERERVGRKKIVSSMQNNKYWMSMCTVNLGRGKEISGGEMCIFSK